MAVCDVGLEGGGVGNRLMFVYWRPLINNALYLWNISKRFKSNNFNFKNVKARFVTKVLKSYKLF